MKNLFKYTKDIPNKGEKKMPKKSYYKQREDDMKILIATVKTRNNLTNKELAKKIGMPASTFNKKSCHPGLFRCSQLWLLEELAGRNE